MRASAKEDKKISLIYIIFNIYSSKPWGNCGKPCDCPKMALLGGFLRFLAIFRLLMVVENRGKTRNDFHSHFWPRKKSQNDIFRFSTISNNFTTMGCWKFLKFLKELFSKSSLSRRPQTAKFSLALQTGGAPADRLEGVKSSLQGRFLLLHSFLQWMIKLLYQYAIIELQRVAQW